MTDTSKYNKKNSALRKNFNMCKSDKLFIKSGSCAFENGSNFSILKHFVVNNNNNYVKKYILIVERIIIFRRILRKIYLFKKCLQ